MEKRIDNKDFVVVVLTATFKNTFSACYVKAGDSYTLWSKVYENDFYEDLCGKDEKDWMASGSFEVQGIYGMGIGTQLN